MSDETSPTLGSLADFEGALVRVGGKLAVVQGRTLTLDDGTGQVLARLADAIPVFDPPLSLGEVLNVSGRVRLRSARPELIVGSAGDVLRAASLASVADPGGSDDLALLAGTIGDGITSGTSGPGTSQGGGGQPWSVLPLGILAIAATLASLVLIGAALLAVTWPRLADRLRARGALATDLAAGPQDT